MVGWWYQKASNLILYNSYRNYSVALATDVQYETTFLLHMCSKVTHVFTFIASIDTSTVWQARELHSSSSHNKEDFKLLLFRRHKAVFHDSSIYFGSYLGFDKMFASMY